MGFVGSNPPKKGNSSLSLSLEEGFALDRKQIPKSPVSGLDGIEYLQQVRLEREVVNWGGREMKRRHVADAVWDLRSGGEDAVPREPLY